MMRTATIAIAGLFFCLTATSSFAIDEDCVSGGCHEKFGTAEVVHEATDYCPDCHVDTSDGQHKDHAKKKATDGDFELFAEVPKLCWDCHDTHAGVTDNLHPPYEDGECLECHDIHQSDNHAMLKKTVAQTCFGCHEEMGYELEEVRVLHEPIDSEKSCLNCHNPHGADPEYYLKAEKVSDLCGEECHDDVVEWVESVPLSHRHGPIQKGKCQACHNPHGSNYASLLRGRYPERFYASWSATNYRACFGDCHDPKKFAKNTFNSFGKESENLHALHVNRSKGRTCRFCHEPHASTNEHLLRTSVPFGLWSFEMNWERGKEGTASCSPACHTKKTYDKAAPEPKAEKEK